MSSDDNFQNEEVTDEEVNEEEGFFENLIEENLGITEEEMEKQGITLEDFEKLLEQYPKPTMHERLGHNFNCRINKIVEFCMKERNLRGMDYFHLIKRLLIHSLTRGDFITPNVKDKNLGEGSSQKKFSSEKFSFSSSPPASEPKAEENPCMRYLEEIKKEDPELIESVTRKEEMRVERLLLDYEKANKAVNEFFEEKHKREAENKSGRMCYLEKKSESQDDQLNLGDFLKKEGFPTPQPQVCPDELFEKFNMDRDTFERDFPLMDEEDFLKHYESIFSAKHEAEEEDEGDILRKRGRFPFTFPSGRMQTEEEGMDINLAKWEQDYWRHREEMEGKSQQKEKEKDPEMELCLLMLVRSGTSWKQELGYTEGWSNTTRLGKQGLKDMEEVAKKVMKGGYKFDYVLSSTLGRSWRSTDIVLAGSNQETIIRNCFWELNPRHRGLLEGGTDLGSASRWGWLPQEWYAFTAPPPIGPRDEMPEGIAPADPSLPASLPRAENIYYVQMRVEGVWTLIRNMFMKGGKRTMLACAHKDSIEALLFHIYGFLPTDFTAWHPSYTTPIILMWYKHGDKFMPAFIDFLCGPEEAEIHNQNFTICWLERFIDQRLLDSKTLTEIKRKLDNGEPIPDMRELWEERFIQSLQKFEKNAETIGQEIRMMDEWLEKGYIITPEDELKITEDSTVFKTFMEDLQLIEDARDPLSDVLTLGEQIEWIVTRKEMPLERKIHNLKNLREFMPPNTDEKTKKLLEKVLEDYESALKSQEEFMQAIKDVNKAPEEKFAEKGPQTWADLKTLDDWYWATKNKKFPGGARVHRKDVMEDWNEDSIEEMEPEEEVEAQEGLEETLSNPEEENTNS